jgi:hypothetical protein
MSYARRATAVALGLFAAFVTVTTAGGVAAANPARNAGGASTSDRGNTPPGNNTTVKVDQFTMDPGHDNDPHVGCGLTVTFFGYDGGPQSATLTLTPWAPTRGGNPYHTSTSWNVGRRTGGGQLDQAVHISAAQLAANNTFAGITPKHEGFHVRLEVEVTGSRGSDDKFKVFWINCTNTSTGTTTHETPTASKTPGSVGRGGRAVDTAAAAATPARASLASTLAAASLASRQRALLAGGVVSAFPREVALGQASAPARVRSGLAFTGVDALLLTLAGLTLIFGGLIFTRRRHHSHTIAI